MKGSMSWGLFGISAALLPLVDCTVSSNVEELCTTRYGTKSVAPVPSTTYALQFTFHPSVLSTLTPVTTVTPAPTTLSATVFTTSTLVETVVTDTYSSTSTETDMSTVQVTPSVTVTTTITTTTTLPTPTSTVPTSSGFIPTVSATATFGLQNHRDLNHPHQPRAAKKALPTKSCHYNGGSHSVSLYPASYPSAFTCNGLIEVYSTTTVVKTGTKTATQTASTPIVTSTATDTITATSYPVDASTTLTFSTTITVPTTNVNPAVTSTVSTTITASYTPPQATYYAACDPSTNQVSSANGYGIDNFAYVGDVGFYGDGNTAPYDCCVACITDPDCGASLDADGSCELFYPGGAGTCAGPNAFAGYHFGGQTQNIPAGQGFMVSDGNCGQAIADGTD